MPQITPTSGVPLGGAPSELVLTESRTMRAATIDRTDVLDKVKALALLPDSIHATTEIVADYYEVDAETVKKIVQRHRGELEENGLRVLRGAQLRDFERDTPSLSKDGGHNRRSLAIFPRRAILNVGQLLTGSEIAKRVRTYLLDLTELLELIATSDDRAVTQANAARAVDILRAAEQPPTRESVRDQIRGLARACAQDAAERGEDIEEAVTRVTNLVFTWAADAALDALDDTRKDRAR